MPDRKKRENHETLFASGAGNRYRSVISTFLQRFKLEGELPVESVWRDCLRSGDFTTLIELTDVLNNTAYSTPAFHFAGRQLSSFIRKYPFSEREVPGINPEARALEKFQESEHTCKRYNQYFRIQRKVLERHASAKQLMRAYMVRLFGHKPDLLAIYDGCDFGPGSNVGIGGIGTSLARKLMSKTWSASPTAAKYLKGAMWRNFHIREFLLNPEDNSYYCIDKVSFNAVVERKLRYVGYNKITFVPKTALVHRTIAVEPLGNSFIQKGIDSWMRSRLLKVGRINLSDQSVNQRLAYAGSLGGHDPYVTIDLASASDSICIELVRELLPPEWFTFLNDIRSPSYITSHGVEIPYEKFCSMGNGFCFPLETAIFAAVCHAAYKMCGNDADFSVYGDDIIVRQSVALLVFELLKVLGFKINSDKTFIFGPFRESCGADYFGGVAVKPITLDEKLDSVKNVIKLHNQLRRHPRMTDLADTLELYKLVPERSRFMRPREGQIDSAFEVDQDVFMSCPYAIWNRPLQTWSWKEFISTARRDAIYKNGPSVLLMMAALRGSSPKVPYAFRRLTDTRVRRTTS